MLAWLKSKWLWLLVGLLLAVGLYALIGFKLVPKLIRSQAMDYAKTEFKKPLSLGTISFNPFKFELDMRDIALKDQGKDVLALQHLFVDFEASSLWQRAYVFRTVQLDKPFARAIVRTDGSLNLVDLLPKSTDDSPIPNINIQNLAVNAGKINFADQSRALKPEKTLTPISFSLKDFKTHTDSGGFKLAAASDDGERFEWNGNVSLDPIKSKGQFKVDSFKAVSAYQFLSEDLPFQLSQGSIDLAGDYSFAFTKLNGLQLDASLPLISVKDLGLRPKKAVKDWVQIPALFIDKTQLSLVKHAVTVSAVHVNGMKADVWMEPDGSINIERLLGSGQRSLVPLSAAAKTNPEAQWTVDLAHFKLANAEFNVEDRTVTPSGKFKLAPLEFSTTGVSMDLNRPLQISVATTINGKAPLKLAGTLVPETVVADLKVELSGMPLSDLLAYLPDYPKLQLTAGAVSAQGQLSLDEKANIGYKGGAVVDDFKMIDANNKSDFLTWQQVKLDGINYQQGPERVAIDSLSLSKPFMEVFITPQQTINIIDALNAPTEATNQSGAKAAAVETPVKIGKIVFQSGAMSFADYSIQPNFQAKIENLNGSILGVSTDANAEADIDLTGYVINKYSPVSIKGQTNILAYDKHTDIQMAFRNIELPVFNPYSGRFAGYAIAKGKLTTELHYKIDDRKLIADHHVILDQLTWGDATDSKDKVSLPIRLATSLLKDKNGVIDLKVPVTGTLDDPKFKIGPIVWQVIKNIVVKIVSAPFSFIGSLFAGADEAQFVDFQPGSAVLSDSAKKSLPILAKALGDKPAVNLDVPAGTLAELDKEGLVEQNLQAAILAQQNIKPGKTTPTYDSLEPKQQLALLEELYKKQFGKKPDIPKAEAVDTAEHAEAGWKEKRAAKKSYQVQWLETQLKPKFPASDAQLVELGKARGAAVQDALLSDGTLDPNRVFLATNVPLSEHEGKVRMELQMK